jgi:hypothetical protein
MFAALLEKRKVFFLERKKQRTFISGVPAAGWALA